LTKEPRDAPQFYLTAPSVCPYLPGREERKVFTHLIGRRAPGLNDALTQSGFRRSQTIAYRPACEACRACVSVRVLAGEFVETRSLRRIRELNADLVGRAVTNQATSDQYSLFRAYVDARHGDGGMADMSVLDYSMMVEDSHVNTRIIEYRRHGPNTAINGRGSGALVVQIFRLPVRTEGICMCDPGAASMPGRGRSTGQTSTAYSRSPSVDCLHSTREPPDKAMR